MLISAVVAAFLAVEVSSHGYAWKPAGRNWYAHEFGVWAGSGSDQDPIKYYNQNGLENGGDTYGACGAKIEQARRWTKPEDILTPAGTLFPFTSQATYTEGQIIDVHSVITAHHKGHIEMYACTDIANPTDACFHANPMDFIDDPLYHAPQDPNYPGRAYLAPSGTTPDPSYSIEEQPSSGMLFIHRFRLPQGLSGSQVLLQWYWVTNLGCRSPGYADYPWPNSSWEPFGSMNTICTFPYADCSREPGDPNCRDPQLFRNCMEVTINAAGPTNPPTPAPPTDAPTPAPPTEPPTPAPTPPPVSSPPTVAPTPALPTTPPPTPAPGTACCSDNYRDCDKTGWCNENAQQCNNCNAMWLANGAISGCTALWERGCDTGDDCCPGAKCVVWAPGDSQCHKD